MSWAAHEFETYVLQRHFGLAVSFIAILIGTYTPDAFTKWYVYGVSKGPVQFGSSDPAQFHRGWPGAGFTHSILLMVVIALVILLASKSKPWALGFFIGAIAHVLTDTSDTVGTLLFWPFWNVNISTGIWAYAAEAGRYDDAGAYYSSLGVIMDITWLAIALSYFSVFREKYFWNVIVKADPWVWEKIGQYMPDRAMVAFYRAGMFYGVTRLFFWTSWSHLANDFAWDLSWGGPDWITPIHLWLPVPLLASW